MRLYKCHKTVQADQIISINPFYEFHDGHDENCRCIKSIKGYTFRLKEGGIVTILQPKLFARGSAEPGDYLVQYGDGYYSWSPKKAFEEGYTAVKEFSLKEIDSFVESRHEAGI